MSIFELLAQLRKRGIRIWQEGGELKFKAPKGAMTPELKSRLLENRGQVIELLKKQEDEQAFTPAESIQSVARNGRLPLSSSQEALWVIDQMSSMGSEYNVPVVLRLEGELDVEALRDAIQTIVRRHEILRTRYCKDEAGVYQVIEENVEAVVPLLDFTALTGEAKTKAVHQAIQALSNQGFDLGQDLMLRVNLIKLDDTTHLLAICIHHIASDGGSLWVLTYELSCLYTNRVSGQEIPLPQLKVQYADFAQWQREWLSSEDASRMLAFWKGTLDGIPDSHNLPLDRPRPARQSFLGTQYRQYIDRGLADELNALAKAKNATLFMVLHSALASLLHRYSHESDIVIGTPIANRNTPELESLVGFFANTLVLRSEFERNCRYDEVLQQSKNYLLAAYRNQQLPFEVLVDAIKPERSLSSNALFQVMLVLQNNRQAQLNLPGLRLGVDNRANGTSKFDLTLLINLADDGYSVDWEYATDLFDQSTIVRMAEHFVLLLREIAADPQVVVDDIALHTESQKHNLLQVWNDTSAELPVHSSLHELFEQRVQSCPGSPAVVLGVESLTYERLNAEANRLAHLLIDRGVTADSVVGLCVPRSPAMIVAMMAILKAGGAYLPLDPTYPDSIIRNRLDACRPMLVITSGETDSRIEHAQTAHLNLDAHNVRARMQFESSANPQVAFSSEQLAYVLSTSGSTGEPKLIGMPHLPLVNLIAAMKRDCRDLDGQHSVLQFASIGFDMSFTDTFLALLGGGKLCLISDEDRIDVGRLAQIIDERDISVANLPYSMLQALTHYANVNDLRFDKLSVLISTAERLLVTEEIREFFRRHPHVRLVNHFGPSETHVCTSKVLEDSPEEWDDIPSIGKPISNVRCYVLDDNHRLAPVGVAGELYVGGIGLARGYLNLDELSRERFIKDPFAVESDARMYRTGDRVRWRDNGEIQYLGRCDTQIKLRGFRIEPGEIEAELLKHPAIVEAAVVLNETYQQLAAYLVADDVLPAVEIKEFMRQRLPEYMQPSAYVFLKSLPLNTNGKIDRKSLPAPDFSSQSAAEYVAPVTEQEILLCDIWRRLLNVERVGLDDNFFDIGGHSLLATRLALEIRAQWRIDFQVRSVFENQTVRMQLALIAATGRTDIPPITKRAHTERPALSFTQQRLWLLTQIEPGSSEYNMPAVMTLDGELDREAMQHVLDTLLTRHKTLRTVYRSDEAGEPYQAVLDASRLPLAFVDLTDLPEESCAREIARLAREEGSAAFDLTHDLMMRATLLKQGERSHTLLVTMHHIASDGWSIGVMTNEASALYAAFVSGKANPLPALEIDYVDFAAWQKSWMTGAVLDSHLAYWKQRLQGIPALHGLPLDKARPSQPSRRAGHVVRKLPKPFAARLHRIARESDATLFMLLSAAYAALIARWSGEQDIVFGTPIANRESVELTPLVGFFINTLVLRLDLAEQLTFKQLLQQSKMRLLEAYEYQQLPFDKLVDELQPARSLSYSPLFQIMLVLQNNEASMFDLPGLTFRPMEQNVSGAKYDLLLNVNENDEGLTLAWEYAEDLFADETIENFAVQFESLLANAIEHPDAALDDLFLPSRQDKELLLSWAQPSTPGTLRPLLFLPMFLEQVARTPDAVAIEFERQTLSYRELDEQSNQVAHYLLVSGCRKGSTVGLCMKRGLSLPIGLLATLKAGGVYVPLDPEYPRERIAYIVGDAKLDLVITDRYGADIVGNLHPNVVSLDRIMSEATNQARSRPEVELVEDDRCYVIYTSGSTGNPKGVIVSHGNLAALLEGARTTFEVGATDVMGALASYSFDISLFELLLPLVAGGRSLMLTKEAQLDMQSLTSALADCTVLHAVPALMSELIQYLRHHPESAPSRIRQVFVGGDRVPRRLIVDIKAAFPSAHITELYGPTEATILSTYHPVTDFSAEHTRSIIGRALPHAEVYVLDKQGRVCAIGVPGELCVGGRGVASGYLGQEELSEAKFVSIDIDGAGDIRRLYRTGDRVRYLPGGELEFLGRIDDQVKIRGHRIELGEVEACLAEIEGIDDAIVTVRKSEGVNQGLVAWLQLSPLVVRDAGSEPFIAEAKAALIRKLPSYMVPQFFKVLDEIPLTANGKVDRRGLEGRAVELSEAEYVAPASEIEQALCGYWQELLGSERVGVTDNFFELGGHSLLVTRLVAWVNSHWGADISVKSVFEKQTIRQLAPLVQSSAGNGAPALVRRENATEHPLSFAQQRLWLLDQIEPGSTQYNMTSVLTLEGTLDIEALRYALNAILERHEVLRTTYAKRDDGSVWQVVNQTGPLDLACIDISAFDDQKRRLAEITRAQAAQTFSLASDRMFRAALLKMHDRHHCLLVTLHHIAYDGWSMGVIVSELSALYAAKSSGAENPLPPLAVQYSDYAHWQRRWLQGPALDRQVEFWKQELSGIPAVHNLPLDRPRRMQRTFAGDYVVRHLQANSVIRIQRFAQENDVTFFMVVSAAFACLLSRYSGETDIAIGCPVANREQTEVLPLVGFFASTIVLRSELSNDESFSTFLERTKQRLLRAYEHQQVPFERLVDELNPERSLNHAPLFQVMLAYQNNNRVSVDMPGLVATQVNHGNPQAKYDITLNIIETAEGIELNWEYATELFDENTIVRMACHFESLLDSAITAPETSIGKLELLSPEELRRITIDWNETRADYPADLCLHQLFEQQADKSPDAIAVVCGDTCVTYRELNEQSNKAAHYLLAHGVRNDDLVALCVERSVEMVIGLMAILKAGAAYVPLDPSYPLDRRRRIIDKAGIRWILADKHNCSDFLGALPLEEALRSPHSRQNPGLDKDSTENAYVIFTSGSTGEPKGVVIAHHSAVNLVTLVNRRFDVGNDDTVLCITSVGFDLSVYDIFGSLATGAKLVISAAGDELDPKRLLSLIEDHGVTFWDSVPSTLNMLVDYFDLMSMQVQQNSLRLAFVSGDWIPTSLPKKAQRYFPRLSVIGLGGATEGTVWSNYHPVVEDVSHLQSVPYGRPLDNNTFYVLDQYRRPVPLGVAGELYIGGVGVAKGYLNDPDKTAVSYVENPYHGALNATMYRTGDLGRILPTQEGLPGNMEFLGRLDNQVKIRGFRIELGEIESCLRNHDLVKEAVVVATGSPSRLVAYVTSAQPAEVEGIAFELRRYVLSQLPEYMVPACFMPIDALPLSSNGKIDRKSLPEPDFSQFVASDIVPPEGEIETRVSAIWERLLGLTSISVVSSFFDVGGQSLLATRLLAEIYREFAVELSIKTLFQAQTIREQASLITNLLGYQHLLNDIDHLSEEELDQHLAELAGEEY